MTIEDTSAKTRTIPVLPLRDIIVFPHMFVPLFVGRAKSLSALKEAMDSGNEILLVAQKKAKTNEPTEDDIFGVGTIGHIIQPVPLSDGTIKVLVEGRRRAKIHEFTQSSPHFVAEVEEMQEPDESTVEIQALIRSVQNVFESYGKLNSKRIRPELLVSIQTIEDPTLLSDTIVANLSLKLIEKQGILETSSPSKRLEKLYELMQAEIEILQVEKKIRTRMKKQMEKSQKEYYLNEQMQAIQKELGDRDEFKNELNELEKRIKAKTMSAEAKERCLKEFRKLKLMSPMSAEATVVRNYIDWVISLPWEEKSEDIKDIAKAEEVLDSDHYGLKKVKERILEHLAVQTLVEKIRGPILCLVGPPGVGKTSLARSIARATGKQFVRQSLGGVRDEAEIRGHRRTYIGALPGKLIQSLKKVGTNNPVFLLDEIDKMTQDFRGDPSSALLEVLDPEQNSTFNDHYLDLDYDLSEVMFITTANSQHQIPLPLQDRLEIINIPGYTDWEKLAIAKKYLIPKQLEANGLADKPVSVEFTDNGLRSIINDYTKEAGVRNLEREIATCARKIAKNWLVDDRPEGKKYSVGKKQLNELLGAPKHRANRKQEQDEIGLANGLAVTMHGGDILPTEITIVPGKGKLTLTGKLGDVMQESAQAALSYIRSRAESLGLVRNFQNKVDIHVHFPEGAIPKDGPSAGITMATGMTSALLRIPVRRDIAMTGEVTLTGRVLPIGGLKEKILAAHRAEIFTVLFPEENEKDLKDIPQRVLKQMTLHPVKHMDEVLRLALAHDEEFLVAPTQILDWRTGIESLDTSDGDDGLEPAQHH